MKCSLTTLERCDYSVDPKTSMKVKVRAPAKCCPRYTFTPVESELSLVMVHDRKQTIPPSNDKGLFRWHEFRGFVELYTCTLLESAQLIIMRIDINIWKTDSHYLDLPYARACPDAVAISSLAPYIAIEGVYGNNSTTKNAVCWTNREMRDQKEDNHCPKTCSSSHICDKRITESKPRYWGLPPAWTTHDVGTMATTYSFDLQYFVWKWTKYV